MFGQKPQFAVLVCSLLMCGAPTARACDDFAGRLLANAVRPAIEKMGCGDLAKIGLDKPEHRLKNLCYSSSGQQSEITISARLKCKTGREAIVQASVSDQVSAHASVR